MKERIRQMAEQMGHRPNLPDKVISMDALIESHLHDAHVLYPIKKIPIIVRHRK